MPDTKLSQLLVVAIISWTLKVTNLFAALVIYSGQLTPYKSPATVSCSKWVTLVSLHLNLNSGQPKLFVLMGWFRNLVAPVQKAGNATKRSEDEWRFALSPVH